MQSPLQSTDAHLADAHRQLAAQQHELDRLRQETYILKEAHHTADAQGLHQAHELQMHSQAAELQDMVSAYKEQLSTSQQRVQQLQHKVNVMKQQQADAAKQAASHPTQLVLETIQCAGQTVFVDKSTGQVYTCRSSDSLLQHCGRWTEHAGIQLDQIAMNFSTGLVHLQQYVSSQQQRFKQVFDMFDTEHLGSLSMSAMPALLAKLLPTATADDMQFILSQLVVEKNDSLTWHELLTAFEASVQACDAMASAAAAVPLPFQQLCARVQQHKQELCDLFGVYDTRATGTLGMRQIAQLLRRILHNVTDIQLRQLVAQLHCQGIHSAASLQNLFDAFRLGAAPKLHSGTHVRSSVNASPAPASQDTSAELQSLQYQLAQLKHTVQQQLHACNSKDAELHSLRHALKQLQQALQTAEKQRIAPALPPAAQHGTEVLENQIRAAWDKANVLKTRFSETRSAFEHLKAQHACVVQVQSDRPLCKLPTCVMHM